MGNYFYRHEYNYSEPSQSWKDDNEMERLKRQTYDEDNKKLLMNYLKIDLDQLEKYEKFNFDNLQKLNYNKSVEYMRNHLDKWIKIDLVINSNICLLLDQYEWKEFDHMSALSSDYLAYCLCVNTPNNLSWGEKYLLEKIENL